MATTIPGIEEKKTEVRVAVVGVDAAAGKLLGECFQQFHIEALALEGKAIEQRLGGEKFEAIVIPLDSSTQALIQTARSSAANRRAVIFGISNDTRDAIRYSRFGINAIFENKWLQEPVDREAVLKVVRATHQLVTRELRRYVRVPIITEVTAQAGSGSFTAYTQEISAGGLSITAAPKLTVGQVLQLTFTLPTGERVNVSASVCWVRDSDSGVGARFDPADERRNVVRDWIEQYLEFS